MLVARQATEWDFVEVPAFTCVGGSPNGLHVMRCVLARVIPVSGDAESRLIVSHRLGHRLTNAAAWFG